MNDMSGNSDYGSAEAGLHPGPGIPGIPFTDLHQIGIRQPVTHPIHTRCPSDACGVRNRPEALFCAMCGTPIHVQPAGDDTFGRLFAIVFFGMIFVSSAITCVSTFL